MKKRQIMLISVIVAAILAVVLVFAGLRKVKIDNFKPAAVMFVIDSSASNQKELPEQKKLLKQICNLLDPEDQIKIIRVSEDAYLIYEGAPFNGSNIDKVMDEFTKYDSKDYGTAYGVGIKKALNYSRQMKKSGYIPSVVVIGDLENEGAAEKQLNWTTFPNDIKTVQNDAPEFSMMFLYAHPSKLDMVKETLSPVLGEEKLIISTKHNCDKAIRSYLHALGR
ncbi:VWA domain-containing protein [bacterium]|nr:VWA domain-containing protein [bacterium]